MSDLIALAIVAVGLWGAWLLTQAMMHYGAQRRDALAWRFLSFDDALVAKLHETYSTNPGKHADELAALRMASEMRRELVADSRSRIGIGTRP